MKVKLFMQSHEEWDWARDWFLLSIFDTFLCTIYLFWMCTLASWSRGLGSKPSLILRQSRYSSWPGTLSPFPIKGERLPAGGHKGPEPSKNQAILAHWPGRLCCVLEQDTLLSPWLTPPRCIVNLMLGITLQWTSILSRGVGRGVEILQVTICDRNWK